MKIPNSCAVKISEISFQEICAARRRAVSVAVTGIGNLKLNHLSLFNRLNTSFLRVIITDRVTRHVVMIPIVRA